MSRLHNNKLLWFIVLAYYSLLWSIHVILMFVEKVGGLVSQVATFHPIECHRAALVSEELPLT